MSRLELNKGEMNCIYQALHCHAGILGTAGAKNADRPALAEKWKAGEVETRLLFNRFNAERRRRHVPDARSAAALRSSTKGAVQMGFGKAQVESACEVLASYMGVVYVQWAQHGDDPQQAAEYADMAKQGQALLYRFEAERNRITDDEGAPTPAARKRTRILRYGLFGSLAVTCVSAVALLGFALLVSL